MVIAPWPQGLVGIPAYAGILFICLVAAMVANGLTKDPPHYSPSPPPPRFFKNDLGENIKGISFNSINTPIGDYLMKFNKFKFHILCSIKKDNFSNSQMPQILIHDVKVIN